MTEEHPTLLAHREFGQVVMKYGPLESMSAMLMVIAEIIATNVDKPQQNKALKMFEKDIKNNIKRIEEQIGRIQ